MLLENDDDLRRNRNEPDLLGRTILQAPVVVSLARVRPLLSDTWPCPVQERRAPAAFGQLQVHLAERHGLSRPEGSVVHASEQADESTDKAEPTDPTDSTDPTEPIDNTESCDHNDGTEPEEARRTDRTGSFVMRSSCPLVVLSGEAVDR